MADVIEVDALTGEVIERDFTEEELSQRAVDLAAFEESETVRLAEEEVKAAAKTSAVEKLAVLGLTEEEVKALLGA